MATLKSLLGAASAAALATVAMAGVARADDPPSWSWSTTIGGTTDYVFRGISQTAEDPAFQMSVDASYGIFYAGVWGSNIDFDNPDIPGNQQFGGSEIDFYAGLKPVTGPITWDLGVLYYWYPASDDPGGFESDYVELKLGASATPVENLSASITGYWSPDNFGETGNVYTVEGGLGYTLPAFGMFTPTIGGVLGYVHAEGDGDVLLTFGDAADDHYWYWNAGLALAVENVTLDFRYHDTDIGDDVICNGATFQCDARFVFSMKFALP